MQGRVVFANKDLDDLIILRSDGTPTYNLSVVVDDHDMGITHVIRGDDHLTNAARQSQIYQGARLGHADLRACAADPRTRRRQAVEAARRARRRSLSRHGLSARRAAQLSGRLGWSHGDDEIMSTDEMIQWFDLDAIGRSAARFDFAKLENLNGHYLRATPDAEIVQRLKALIPELPGGAALLDQIGKDGWAKLARAMSGLKERAKTLVELLDNAAFLFAKRPLALDGPASKLLDAPGRQMLAALLPRLERAEPWTAGHSRGCRARLCRGDGPEARQGGSAAAGRFNRPVNVPRYLRCA